MLLAELAPRSCDTKALRIDDRIQRAKIVIDNAEKLDIPRVITPSAIVNGHGRMNFSFLAHLFLSNEN